MWKRITSVHLLCSIAHILCGALIAFLLFYPLSHFSPTSGRLGAILLAIGFGVYESWQWFTHRDAPSEEIGEALVGFCVATVALIALRIIII